MAFSLLTLLRSTRSSNRQLKGHNWRVTNPFHTMYPNKIPHCIHFAARNRARSCRIQACHQAHHPTTTVAKDTGACTSVRVQQREATTVSTVRDYNCSSYSRHPSLTKGTDSRRGRAERCSSSAPRL
jgi:hypothetical protein